MLLEKPVQEAGEELVVVLAVALLGALQPRDDVFDRDLLRCVSRQSTT